VGTDTASVPTAFRDRPAGTDEGTIIMELIAIDRERCRKDGLCQTVCPLEILQDGPDGFPQLKPSGESKCLACGHCQAVCPHGALTLSGVSPDDCAPVRHDLALSWEATESLVKSRRSIRMYKDAPVPRETLVRLLDMVRWAPTARNLLPVRWTIIEDRAQVHELGALIARWIRVKGVYRHMANAWDRGQDLIFRGAPQLALAHAGPEAIMPTVDCTIAATTLDLAASAVGLGTCWAGVFMNAAQDDPAVREFLHLPPDHQVYAALMLGYPKARYARLPSRPAPDIHWL
jgi:nitroreductase/ferredoxin